MNVRRFQYYLVQAGCPDQERSAPRPPNRRTLNQHCDHALGLLGFPSEQIAQLDRAIRSEQVRQFGENSIFLAVDAVAAGIMINRFEPALSGLSLLMDNWGNLKLAYSVADAVGWDTTARAAMVTTEATVKISCFLIHNSTELQEWAEAAGLGAELATAAPDLVDALLTGELSVVLSGLAWGFVRWMNAEPARQLKAVEERTRHVQELHVLLATGALPAAVRKVLPHVPDVVARPGYGPTNGRSSA